MIIKEIFGDKRIVGLAGNKSEGKTNNLMALIEDFRKENKETPVYVYGMDEICLEWLSQFAEIYEISELSQLSDKKNCMIVMDEFQRLHLNDRHYKELLDEFIDFIYRNNNWVIFSSPNLREFNSVIGSKIERWVLKSLDLQSLVNGSQLKMAVMEYNGRFKVLKNIRIEKNRLLVINSEHEKVISVRYIVEVDVKRHNIDIFGIKIVGEKGKENGKRR